MSKKSDLAAFSRRKFLSTAIGAGLASVAMPAFAQTAFDDVINAPSRGNWDDQFDANASRTAATVKSNNPILGPEAVPNIQAAILEYQQIVAAGGWPQINPGVKLQLGVIDPSVQPLRQRLIISGDLPQERRCIGQLRQLCGRCGQALPGAPRSAGRRRHG